MKHCKPVGTPFNENSKLLKLSDQVFRNVQREVETIPYNARVGLLMYAMVGTWPDVAFKVNTVS